MGRMVCADHISLACAGLNKRVFPSGPNVPPLSCTAIHFARSATQVMMAPAGALLSMSSWGSACSLPESVLCGVATSLPCLSAATSVNVFVMPSGVKMCSFTKSSQLLPVTAGINCPATMRSEEHTSELQSLRHLVCRLLLEI